MRFTEAIDIWSFPQELLQYLPAGQWVKAGPNGPLGRFYGIKKSGVIVVSWKNKFSKTLHNYAKT